MFVCACFCLLRRSCDCIHIAVDPKKFGVLTTNDDFPQGAEPPRPPPNATSSISAGGAEYSGRHPASAAVQPRGYGDDGQRLTVVSCATPRVEAAWIASKILQRLAQGGGSGYGAFAVLLRTGMACVLADFETVFKECKIPYVIAGKQVCRGEGIAPLLSYPTRGQTRAKMAFIFLRPSTYVHCLPRLPSQATHHACVAYMRLPSVMISHFHKEREESIRCTRSRATALYWFATVSSWFIYGPMP